MMGKSSPFMFHLGIPLSLACQNIYWFIRDIVIIYPLILLTAYLALAIPSCLLQQSLNGKYGNAQGLAGSRLIQNVRPTIWH